MANILYLLIKHKGVMAKLRKELDETLGPDFLIPNYDHVRELPYLEGRIKEELRLRPPLSPGLPRKTVAETHIAGHVIKTGVTVSVPTWSFHHDERLFLNAEAFLPERWVELDTEILKSYIVPFSQGQRACIGRKLTYLKMLVFISALVGRYDFAFEDPEFISPVFDRRVAYRLLN